MQAITSTVTVLRAIGVVFAQRKLRPFIIGGGIMIILMHAGAVWLITQSAWWWILETLLIVSTLLFVALCVVALLILRRVSPSLTPVQRRSVNQFVDKLERIAENLQTPQPVILFYVVRDAIRPREDTFIKGMIHDSTSLSSDFASLCDKLAGK